MLLCIGSGIKTLSPGADFRGRIRISDIAGRMFALDRQNYCRMCSAFPPGMLLNSAGGGNSLDCHAASVIDEP